MRSAPRPGHVIAGPVILDIQALQNLEYAERGVARHTMEFARALTRRHPDLVGGLLANPDLPVPDLGSLATAAPLLMGDAQVTGGRIFHVIAPFELEVSLERMWPQRLAGMHLVVTLHDLIPRRFPDHYHADPGFRRRYLAREELVRAADRVLCVSQFTRDEAVALLDIAPHRLAVIGAGIAEEFRPPSSRAAAFEAAAAAVPGLQQGFLLYVGGIDHRKNIDGLLAGYAQLPAELRRDHQLVVACRLAPERRAALHAAAGRLGIASRLLLTGFVDEAALVSLYQSTALFVFPSLSEGYGLPVAEAMACGAPVVAADNSATAELADPAGQFDASDPASIGGAMRRALTDPATRAALQAASGRPSPSWADAADRAAAAYRDLLERPRPRRRCRRVGFVTPLPPQRSGVAIYSERLLEALTAGGDLEVDVFVDALEGGPAGLAHWPRPPAGTAGAYPVERLGTVAAARGGYDVMVYAIGNSEFHTGALCAALARPGIVLAHEVALAQLYAFAAHHGVLPSGFGAHYRRMYPQATGPLPDPLLVDPSAFDAGARARGERMARDIIAASWAFLTTSGFAAGLARAEARPEDAERVGVLALASRVVPLAAPTGDGGALVASFGVVNRSKDLALLLEAFSLITAERPDARLVLVGHASARDRQAVTAEAQRLGIAPRLTVTGSVDDAAWDGWLRRARVAVQLRRASNGEFSAAVAECLAFGVPTIVTAAGSAGELPGAAVVAVPAATDAAALAAEISALLDDPARREALAAEARSWASARSFEAIAGELRGWIERACEAVPRP